MWGTFPVSSYSILLSSTESAHTLLTHGIQVLKMGKKNMLRTERLPKCERAPVESKVRIRRSVAPPAWYEFSALQISRPRRAYLDDDALRKVLLAAGPSGMLAASAVCVQWSRVARQLLSEQTRVDLSRLYAARAGNAHLPPGYAHVLRTVQQFPNLAVLTVQRWPFEGVMDDVAEYLCSNYAGMTLREVEFSGMLLSGTSIVQLLKNCPNMHALRLDDHPSVNDKLLNAVGLYCKQRRLRDGTFSLQTIRISRTRGVTKTGLGVLLEHAGVNCVQLSKCDGLRSMTWRSARNTPLQSLGLVGCINMARFLTIIKPGAKDMLDLNLSQCGNLLALEFRSSGVVGSEQPLCLRRLNLSGCRMLREIGLHSFEDAWRFLERLEELILFGAFNLQPQFFSTIFGFSRSDCSLPKLRRLDVNGCCLDTLMLVGYDNLNFIDCSGCAQLNTLEIRNCWQLETLAVLGRRAPLQRVKMILPANCLIRGMRSQWHWESYESNQTIMYP